MAQWQSTGGSSQRFPGFDSRRLPAFSLSSIFVPRPPRFLPSVCVHNITQERKTSEKRGRPGNIHHVSGRELEEGSIFKYMYIRTKLESEGLTGQDELFLSC